MADQGRTDLWVYRMSCAHCLSIAKIEIPELGALARSEASSPIVDVAGSVVARLLERLRAARGRTDVAGVLADARADAERRVLLRIPEVLAASRSAFADGVRLAEDLIADWPALHDSRRPAGRLTLRRPPRALSADPVIVAGEALELRLRAGQAMTVSGFEGGSVLLVPPRDEPAFAEWLVDVDVLVAWADFVAPGE